jgi:hypothetical protein
MAQIIITIGFLMLLWSPYMEWWVVVAAWAIFLFLANYHHIRKVFAGKGGSDEPSQDG